MARSQPPSKQQRLWQGAEQHVARRQWRQAVEGFLAITAHDPGHVPAWLKAADGLLQLDRYRDARQCALSAAARPEWPRLRVQVAHRLRRLNESQALFDLAGADISQLQPGDLTELASLVSSAGGQALARRLIEDVVDAAPGDAKARYLRGAIAMFEGDTARAESEFETCLRLAPDFAQAHWMLSGMRDDDVERRRVDRVRASLGRAVPGSQAEAHLGFALHNELHALGRHEESWQALMRGCAARRRATTYDPRATAELFAQVKARCGAEFLSTPPVVEAVGTPVDAVPIFIVGMHRSGTTLLERILAGHSQVSDGGESYLFTAQLALACDHEIAGALDTVAVGRLGDADFAAIGDGFLAASRWRAQGRACFTEKLPPNVLNAGFIARALPHAKILHMVRDPVDTCFSNLRTYFGQAAAYSFEQHTLADYYGHYRDLMRHWHEVMPGRILDIAYDDLVGDTDACARRVFAFCGLPFEAQALAVERGGGTAATASHAHVRRGILGDRGGAWRPYETQLQPLLRRLDELDLRAEANPAARA